MSRILAVLVAAGLVGTLALSSSAFAAGNPHWGTEYVHPGPDIHKGKKPIQAPTDAELAAAAANDTGVTGTTPAVGTQRQYLALNDYTGRYYFKTFTLKGVGQHAEVWVANTLTFPAGDCRNGVRTTITDAQVQYFLGQFDGNILPKESAAFSVAPGRDGSHAVLPRLVGLPANYYEGESDNTLILVDNVRDANYYDTNNAHGRSYIAGFFSGTLNTYFDRNTMTIDAWDWLHRTGANPPNEPTTDLCTSAGAKPFSYEGVFAHEYQHLLESYASPGEQSWVNEGLSDYAISVTGYGHPEKSIDEVGFESHVQCFMGWLAHASAANTIPRPASGPENSLTLWGDQGDGEILCDYGAGWSFMLYLQGRFGDAFLSALHREPANGLAGLQATLDHFLTGETALGAIHKWNAAMALDASVEKANIRGGRSIAEQVGIPGLHASIDWANPEAYATPGAPPNGADYVRLRDAAGNFLSASQITSITFAGARTFPASPPEWTVDGGALYSGSGDEVDRAIIHDATVPAGAPTLTFRTRYNAEVQWDFGFVQVSTDGGQTYRSLACPGTRSDYDPSAYPTVKANVPGYSGVQDWTTVTCDLSAYAGQSVLLSFRYVTDWSTEGNDGAGFAPGWWIDDVAVGGTVLSDGGSLAGWRSPTEVNPTPVNGFTVQLVGISSTGATASVVAQIPLDASFRASLDKGALRRLIGDELDVVAALVTYDEPTEQVKEYAPYALTVNGALQPGGGS